MNKVWSFLPRVKDDLVEHLLSIRGITTDKEKEQFLYPKLEYFKKELEIPGIDKALERIEQSIKNQELIVVYGDYDVDGICSSAIAYKALTALGAKVLPFIPHREKDGYGLSKSGIEYAKEQGAKLIVTVDNGIVALEQAKMIKDLGMDLIITDHHLPLDTMPEACAIVHSTVMCGSGVAWCLFSKKLDKDLKEELLQFAAIGSIADLIPLVDLTRALVVEGLKELNQTTNIGLLALLNECGLVKGMIGSYEVSHIISPRLNAIGRLEHAIDALRLLCTKEPSRARKLAQVLTETNSTRQKLTSDAIDQVKTMIGENNGKKIHIYDSKEWVPGIIGLIAGRICEEYGRPAIAISVGETHAKGSARSINGVNIVEVIRQCGDLLVDVGGHKGAAGFSLPNEHIEDFKLRMEQLMVDLPDEVEQIIEIEAEVESKQIKKTLFVDLEQFSPFGYGNQRPLLATKRMKLSDIRTVGSGKHLKLKADGIEAIGFGLGQLEAILSEGQLVDVAYYLDINKFNGSEILQLKIKDVRLSE